MYIHVYSGENACKLGLTDKLTESFSIEYSDLRMNVEVVSSIQNAIEHINKYGRYMHNVHINIHIQVHVYIKIYTILTCNLPIY
jgi:gamma-glutamyl phosphate reductase